MIDYEDWDEPILARDYSQANQKCKKLAEKYQVQLQSTQRIQPNPVARHKQPNWRCIFRNQKES
ncbi:MAG: hypothetical protein AAF892_01155 [Cyanobacteria bacterium P01_D01_bin.71]